MLRQWGLLEYFNDTAGQLSCNRSHRWTKWNFLVKPRGQCNSIIAQTHQALWGNFTQKSNRMKWRSDNILYPKGQPHDDITISHFSAHYSSVTEEKKQRLRPWWHQQHKTTENVSQAEQHCSNWTKLSVCSLNICEDAWLECSFLSLRTGGLPPLNTPKLFKLSQHLIYIIK